jgi:hypothetical protein
VIRRMKYVYTRSIDGLSGAHVYVEPAEYVDASAASDVELAYGYEDARRDEQAKAHILDAWRARYSRHDGERPWNFNSWAWHIHLSAYPENESDARQAAATGMIATGDMTRHAYSLHAPLLYRPIAAATDADVAHAWRRCPDQRAELEADWRRRHARDEDLRSWAQPIHQAAYQLEEVAS